MSHSELESGTPETLSSAEFSGVPDCFQRLWTPHRMAYVTKQGNHDECPFCEAPTHPDEDRLIVRRGEHCFVVMNLFPYSPGHVLICTYRHVADYRDLTIDERAEMAELTQQAMRVIQAVSNPAGFNLGMNQGKLAGAGVAAHIHQHVVPRWTGDMNFLPIVAQTRAVPQLLDEARRLLASAWSTHCES